MPRNRWVPKNKFCRKSKLDSSEFGMLVQYYFREVLFSEPRDVCYYDYIMTCHFNDTVKFIPNKGYDDSLRIKHISTSFVNCIDKENYKSLRETLDFKNKPISKESFNNYFNRMGQCIWERFIVGLHPSFQEEDVFDDLMDFIYQKIDKISSYREFFFDFLNGYPLYLNEKDLMRSLMFHLLEKRSKVTRGFSKDTFYLEFSRVYFICEVIEKYKVKWQSLDSVEEVEKMDEIVFTATIFFLSKLIENPM